MSVVERVCGLTLLLTRERPTEPEARTGDRQVEQHVRPPA